MSYTINAIDDTTMLSDEVCQNPYPFYHHMLRDYPVYWSSSTYSWYVFNYQDVSSLLRNPHLSANRLQPIYNRMPAERQVQTKPLFDTFGRWTLLLDPPLHTKFRKLISAAFAPRLIEPMLGHISEVTEGLLDDVAHQAEIDIIHDIAYPLPAIVIAEMLGANPNDRDLLKQWSTDIAIFFGTGSLTDEILATSQRSVLSMTEYFRDILIERRKKPQPDLMTYLLASQIDGHSLSDDELLATCIMLLFAGHETTTNLIGNGMLALLRYESQLRLLRANQLLLKPAIEEILRFDSPVQRISRMASDDINLHGQQIMAGQRVTLVLGAANHDPAQFFEPSRFDITRSENRHLAFGFGPHFCIGAVLAREEGAIAIRQILERYPTLQLATPEPLRNTNFAVRGLTSLPVNVQH